MFLADCIQSICISYAVCKYFGIETGENSFGYIASWSQGKELKELRASLETINKTSGTLISDIERHYDTQSLAKFAFSMFWRAMRFAEEQQVPILLDY